MKTLATPARVECLSHPGVYGVLLDPLRGLYRCPGGVNRQRGAIPGQSLRDHEFIAARTA